MSEKRITLLDAEHKRRGMISTDQCETLMNAGLGRAIRTRRGLIKCFVYNPVSRVYSGAQEGVAVLHSASCTTQAIHAGGDGRAAAGQVLGNRRLIREHRQQ